MPTDERAVPPQVLGAPVQGLNLGGATLSEVLGAHPTLLVFLRHFG